MLHLVYGGSGSGKSAYAEKLVEECAAKKRYYLATMQVYGKEDELRIKRHRKMRQEKNFITLEKTVDIGEIRLEPSATVLLECMSNLVANEMFREDGGLSETQGEESKFSQSCDRIEKKILTEIKKLYVQVENLIVVTADVFDDGVLYSPETVAYQKLLARINAGLAEMADEVTEVVVGIPLPVKK